MKRLLLSLALALFALPALAEVRTFDWLELIPEDELKLLQDQAVVDHDGEPIAPDYSESTPVLALNGAEGRLPGYIVPVTITEDNKISEFFVVPYFGACIHVPPPPPNQIVYVTLATPIAVTDIYDAFWVEGTLRVETVQKDIAASAYVLAADKVTLYEG